MNNATLMADAIIESSRDDLEILYDRAAFLSTKVRSNSKRTIFIFNDESQLEITDNGMVTH